MQIGGVYTIDFAKVSKIPRFSVNIKNGDSKRTIKLILLKNNEVLNLNNYTVVVAAKKADRKDIFNDVKIIDAEAGTCEVEITEQMLATNLDLPCEIVLYEADGTVASSNNFVISIIKSVRDEEGIRSSSEFTALTKALAEVKEIDNRFSATKKEVEVERKRIDSFTSLKEGSTTGDAELMDARTGADGITYSNVGDANRTQFATLNKFVYTLKNGTNVFQNVKIFADTELDGTGGTFEWNDIMCSDFIPVDKNTKYAFLNESLTYISVSKVCFYDREKKYIGSGFTNGNVGSYAYMENQAYIRFSAVNATMSKVKAIQPYEENTWTYILSDDIKEENYIKKVELDGLLKPTYDKFEEKLSIVDGVIEVKYRNINNSEFESGNITDTGETVDDSSYLRTKSFIKVVGGKTIYLKKLKGANVYDIFEYDANFKFIKKTPNIYDYVQTDYTRFLKLDENTKYIKFRAWWTEPVVDIKIAVYYKGCDITEYEDYTEPKIKLKGISNDFTDYYRENLDSLISETDDKKPVIVFNFDESSLDNRYTALQNAGFTGTWQFATTSFQYSKDIINTLVKSGHDISPYAGLSEEEYKDVANHEANIEKLKAIVSQELKEMQQLGIYNPVMFSCSRHRGGYVVKEAIKDLNFKYIRCSWGVDEQGNDYYIPESCQPDNKEQYPIPLTQYKTLDSAKVIVDSLISQKTPLIMLMCHTMSYDEITEENYFENLVDYIKTLSDKGIVKVMNMREYYEYHHPVQGKKDDRVRIMSAINDIKRLNLN